MLVRPTRFIVERASRVALGVVLSALSTWLTRVDRSIRERSEYPASSPRRDGESDHRPRGGSRMHSLETIEPQPTDMHRGRRRTQQGASIGEARSA